MALQGSHPIAQYHVVVGLDRAIVCVHIPSFELRVLAHARHDWSTPLALVSSLDPQPVVRDANEAARCAGVEDRMGVARAYGICPGLVIVEHDQSRVDAAYELMLSRLEGIGAAVAPEGYGIALFDAVPLRRLYRSVAGVVDQTRRAFRAGSSVRIGVASNMFLATVAARLTLDDSDGGSVRVLAPGDERKILRRLPLAWTGIDGQLLDTFDALGLRTCGDVAAIDRAHMADRFGAEGERVWLLATGEERRVLCPRVPIERVEESLAFPEPLGNLHVWQQAVRQLVERLTGRGDMQHYALRSITVRAALLTGTTWQCRKVLRDPTRNPERIALAALQPLEEIPAPVERFDVLCDQLVPAPVDQLTLERSWGAAQHGDGIRHVQEVLGDDALLQVFELDPDSRIPEHRSLLVPARADAS